MRRLWRIFQSFLFQPIGTESLGLFRIVFGLLVLQQLTLGIAPDLLLWFGSHSAVPFDLVQQYAWQGEARFDLLALLPNDAAIVIYFSSLVLAALFLVLGLFSRFSSAYLAMGLVSLHHHNPALFNGGDNMMRIMSIFLALSPCGASYSLDAKLGLVEKNYASFLFPWSQRMIQIQMAIAYCGAFWVKAISPQWYDGSAIYFATRLVDFMNGEFPLLDQIWFCKLACWFTLAVELASWTLIWMPRCRKVILPLLVFLHLSIDYLFRLPVFEYVFIAGLITFIPPENIRGWVSGLFGNKPENVRLPQGAKETVSV